MREGRSSAFTSWSRHQTRNVYDVTLAITDSNPLGTQLCFEDYDGEYEKTP